jgi:hypothetical protein
MGRDDQGRALLCEAHRDRNLRAIALIRAQHAGDPRWTRSQSEPEALPPEGMM